MSLKTGDSSLMSFSIAQLHNFGFTLNVKPNSFIAYKKSGCLHETNLFLLNLFPAAYQFINLFLIIRKHLSFSLYRRCISLLNFCCQAG